MFFVGFAVGWYSLRSEVARVVKRTEMTAAQEREALRAAAAESQDELKEQWSRFSQETLTRVRVAERRARQAQQGGAWAQRAA